MAGAAGLLTLIAALAQLEGDDFARHRSAPAAGGTHSSLSRRSAHGAGADDPPRPRTPSAPGRNASRRRRGLSHVTAGVRTARARAPAPRSDSGERHVL